MSFQHFRLGELVMTQPLPPHLMQHKGTTNNINGAPPDSAAQFITTSPPNQQPTFAANQENSHTSVSAGSLSKQPYGSGDADDGYTLVFPNLDAFNAWRLREEETQVVEFVKGDTHGSKAVPPRFKDHTKLVCARHSRSGRKKYVKKHPERVRKVPSRKLEGTGCSASISYKTYFDSETVRACYMSQHSHEIGPANLPFTRRGRKAAAQQQKERRTTAQASPEATPSTSSAVLAEAPSAPIEDPPPADVPVSEPQPEPQPPAPAYPSAISQLAPLPPPQPIYTPPAALPFPQPPHPYAPDPNAVRQDRWDNMATLFSSVREHARTFAYPAVSVAALETVLIRLYLESPVALGGQTALDTVMHSVIPQAAQQQTAPAQVPPTGQASVNGPHILSGSPSNS
ncbi:hypothetical protein HGRIS_008173 [Hohenbuehelia grisea]|uniref:WRKY domain-containing protein n=1 Tax=Hohenbuehelia grisea TaxID=104357 RepID=A0ABR3J7J9_9AGAR